jgi:hypothetical protein
LRLQKSHKRAVKAETESEEAKNTTLHGELKDAR